MCILAYKSSKGIASKNIKCYKVLKKVNGMYMTPFFETIVDTLQPQLPKENRNGMCWSEWENAFIYGPGYVFACTSIEHAKRWLEAINSWQGRQLLHIFECTIPAGTPYVVGNGEIAAKKLVYEPGRILDYDRRLGGNTETVSESLHDSI